MIIYNVVCKNLFTSLQAADGIKLYEDDEELTCNLCQRRFEEQGTYLLSLNWMTDRPVRRPVFVLKTYSAYVWVIALLCGSQVNEATRTPKRVLPSFTAIKHLLIICVTLMHETVSNARDKS